jgi:acetyl esterase/lipase
MDKINIDPELAILKPLRFSKYTASRRVFINWIIRLTLLFTKPKKGVSVKRYRIKGYQHRKVRVSVFSVKHHEGLSPGLLYIHGGGFEMEGTPVHLSMLQNMILASGHTAIYVKYHLSPKNPFPAALFDCYHALLWMKEHAEFLNIDEHNITVAGDSAGGNLAAGVTLLSRDKNGPKIKKQMLIYPVLDVLQQTPSMREFTTTPMWNAILNDAMWKSYLKNGDLGMIQYASPSLAHLDHLPEAYIETAEFDCLRDEGINYAEKLLKAGVPVTSHHTLGTVHGYDAVFYSRLMKNMLQNRISFLKR